MISYPKQVPETVVHSIDSAQDQLRSMYDDLGLFRLLEFGNFRTFSGMFYLGIIQGILSSSSIFFNHPFRGFQAQKKHLFLILVVFDTLNKKRAYRAWCRKRPFFLVFMDAQMIYKFKNKWSPWGSLPMLIALNVTVAAQT